MKTLVTYFSAESGRTAGVAEELADDERSRGEGVEGLGGGKCSQQIRRQEQWKN